ncbi:MAG: hypothetical protein M3Q39_09760 [Actinomycetota bacterium]|nr:hypothetical protein [Actinomycetota bacterium]
MAPRSGAFGREPALIVGALGAVIALAVGFGLPVSPEQVGLILAAVTALLAVVTRQQVTPTAVLAAEASTDYTGQHRDEHPPVQHEEI